MHRLAPVWLLVTGCGVAFVGDPGAGGSAESDGFGGAPGTSTGTATGSATGTATGTSSGGPSSSSAGGATGGGGSGGAGGEAEPEWVVVETLTVPVDGSTVTSTTVLGSAGTYRLRASGTFTISTTSNILADAEYFDFSAPPGSVTDSGTTVDHGLAIDDSSVDLNRSPKWGSYDPSHVYVVDHPGKDLPVVAQFHDEVVSNNEGSLTLEILSLEPPER